MVGLLLSGCGAQASTGSSASTSATGRTSSTSPPEGGRMTSGLSVPLVLTRTGGIAGVDDRLEVRPDGTLTATSRGQAPVTRQLSEGEQAAVVAAVAAADLPGLAQAQPPGSPSQAQDDAFTYVVQAQGRTVTASGSGSTVEPGLQRLLDVLQPLFSARAPGT